jgi:tRNA-dihydrouridine synthase
MRHYLATGELLEEPSVEDKIEMARLHAQLMQEQFGEERGAIMMRRYLGWYVKGFKGASELRPQLFQVTTISDIDRVFAEYLAKVTDDPSDKERKIA